MATNINIEKGESVSIAFEINGIALVDLLDFVVYVGDWKFSLGTSTIEQASNLFTVRLNSNLTTKQIGMKSISFAIVTDFLGVYKEDKIGYLSIRDTNERTVLDEVSQFVVATFVIDVNSSTVTTNPILENIYKGADGSAVDATPTTKGITKLFDTVANDPTGAPNSQAVFDELALKANTPLLVTNASVSGTYNINWSKDTWDLILTGITTLTETNLPISGTNTKTISLYVTGNFALTYPAGWGTKMFGTYNGTILNQIVVEFRSTSNYWVTINN